MSGIFPAKSLAELGCSYTVQADSISLVGENVKVPMLCMKVGRAAILFPLNYQAISGLRIELAKL